MGKELLQTNRMVEKFARYIILLLEKLSLCDFDTIIDKMGFDLAWARKQLRSQGMKWEIAAGELTLEEFLSKMDELESLAAEVKKETQPRDMKEQALEFEVLRLEMSYFRPMSKWSGLEHVLGDVSSADCLQQFSLYALRTSSRFDAYRSHSWWRHVLDHLQGDQIRQWKWAVETLRELGLAFKACLNLVANTISKGQLMMWKSQQQEFDVQLKQKNECWLCIHLLCGVRYEPPRELQEWRKHTPILIGNANRRFQAMEDMISRFDESTQDPLGS